jgi:hypothetical protein
MPARRVPRLSSLVGSIGAALVLAAALAPVATPAVHAQDGAGPAGPMMGPMGGPGMGPGMGPMMGGPGMGPMMGGGPGMGPRGMDGYDGGWGGELVVPGQVQHCHESLGAQANARAYYGPQYLGYNFPPYGGIWGFYTGVANVCRWQPH